MVFAFIGWLIAGLVIGFVASKLVDLRGDEPLIGIIIAVVGAMIGGFLYHMIGGTEITPWNMPALLAAAAGAIVAVAIYHLIRSRTINKDVQTVRRSY